MNLMYGRKKNNRVSMGIWPSVNILVALTVRNYFYQPSGAITPRITWKLQNVNSKLHRKQQNVTSKHDPAMNKSTWTRDFLVALRRCKKYSGIGHSTFFSASLLFISWPSLKERVRPDTHCWRSEAGGKKSAMMFNIERLWAVRRCRCIKKKISW